MDDELKRVRPRVEFDYSVMCFKRLDSDGNEKGSFVMKVQVVDISFSGMGIIGNSELDIDDILILNISHKTRSPLQFSCVVKRCCLCGDEQYSSGLEFKDLTREHIFLLNTIIKENNMNS